MTARIRTTRLELVSKSKADVQAMIDSMSPYEKAQMSAGWLARFAASKTDDPWIYGFTAVRLDDHVTVGTGGFATPPTNGMAEIAYSVDQQFRSRGYAQEIARGLVAFVLAASDVETIRAHTLPDGAASQQVLLKCGFERVGEVDHPEDGLVWRFERYRHTSGGVPGDVTIVSLT
jgi:RimJ/RimL family protein N-acetyltransferase